MRPALWHRNNFATVPTGVATAAPVILYNFTNTADSWTASGATLTTAATYLTVASTSIDPIIRRTVSFSGRQYQYVQIYIFRTAGSTWDGKVFFSTAGHGESALFYKQITEPTWDGVNYQLITVDMSTLSVGGTDWADNTITGVRLDFGATATDSFRVDYIQFKGTIYPQGGLYQYTQAGYFADNVSFFTAMTATGPISNISTQLTTATTSYQYLGYFLPAATGIYKFGMASDDAGYLWIGSKAISGYTTTNAAISQPGIHGAVYSYSNNFLLTAGVYYPIRFMTGQNTGGAGEFLSWSQGGASYSTDGTGYYFYNSDTGSF